VQALHCLINIVAPLPDPLLLPEDHYLVANWLKVDKIIYPSNITFCLQDPRLPDPLLGNTLLESNVQVQNIGILFIALISFLFS
jgi:hypothetical protein